MKESISQERTVFRSDITLLRPEQLWPTEAFIPDRVQEVGDQITAEGRWRFPLLVERTSLVIMDGHHRHEFALRHELYWVPCFMLDYSQVILESRLPTVHVSPSEVILRGLQGRLYPPKTTKHTLRHPLDFRCDIALPELLISKYTDSREGNGAPNLTQARQ